MPLRITCPNRGQHPRRIVERFLLEYGRQSCSCVFGIHVDIAGDHRLLREKRAAEIELAAHVSVQSILEVLRDDFAEYELFGEILRAYADAWVMTATSQQGRRHHDKPRWSGCQQAFVC